MCMSISTWFHIYCDDSLSYLKNEPDNSVDFIFGSPPYAEKGERYIGGKPTKWPTSHWVVWMKEITREAVRVSSGYVIWIVNGSVCQGSYRPAVEGLLWELYKEGDIACERPAIWHKNAPPNRRDWFGNDWEYCAAFKKKSTKPYFDWQAVGTPPKYNSGGKFRQRDSKGNRKNGGEYPSNPLTRPRDVVRCLVGGGQMGSKLVHENEAPFPEALASHFIKCCSPVGGVVLDPFVGSGTTIAAALKLGRSGIGVDCRQSQVDLTIKRIKEEVLV